MHWPEVRAALDSGTCTVVAAAGSMEQHGPHLPFQTDTLLGTVLASAVASRLNDVIVGPTIPFGVSEHHMAFPGTITLDTPTFKEVVRQYVASLARHGFENVVILPSHGGNFGTLASLFEETGGRIGACRKTASSLIVLSVRNEVLPYLFRLALITRSLPREMDTICGTH